MKTLALALTLSLFAAAPALADNAKPLPKKTDAPATAMASNTATSPVSSEPESSTADYGDWSLHCTRIASATPRARLCEVVQSITVQGQQGPVAQIALGRIKADDPLKLTVVLPHNLSFPSEVRLSVDDKDAHGAELNWRRCLPGGCFADADVQQEQEAHWRSQSDKGRLQFKDAAARDVTLPFSFRGLAQALDALDKS